MSFLFMVLHYAKVEHRETLVQSMTSMRDGFRSLPGCLAVEPPYLTEDGPALSRTPPFPSVNPSREAGVRACR